MDTQTHSDTLLILRRFEFDKVIRAGVLVDYEIDWNPIVG